jgi:energy-coupling factor transport system substrate-specific component
MRDYGSYCGVHLPHRRIYLLVLPALLLGVINALFAHLATYTFELPLFLDTIGTLVSAALFGPVFGLLTAAVTHVVPFVLPVLRPDYIYWIVCSAASVVVLWLFIRKGRFIRPMHAIVAAVVVTVMNAVTGAAVAVFFFAGLTGHPVDYMMTGFLSIGQSVVSAAFWARIPINFIDKGIAVFAAYGVYVWCRNKTARRKASAGKR